jgi:hypothetical protein
MAALGQEKMCQSRDTTASATCYNADMIRANVLDRFLDPFGAFLTPEVAQRPVDFHVDEQTQALSALADKCTEGQLTPAEREEYDTYISVLGVRLQCYLLQLPRT